MRTQIAKLLRSVAAKLDDGMCCRHARDDRASGEASERNMRGLETTGAPEMQARYKRQFEQRRMDQARLVAWSVERDAEREAARRR